MGNRTGQIILCKNINVDRDYKNVLNYSEAQMLSLCRSNEIASSSNCSFIKPNGSIKVPFTYSQCLQANYLAFQNPDYSNKWFFAWVDDVIYKADGTYEITFTIDLWSTWFSKLTIADCFVIREHVNDDTIGLHTIPENLDVGDVICEKEEEILTESYQPEFDGGIRNLYIVETTYDPYAPPSEHDFSGITVINNNVMGSILLAFKDTANLDNFISYMADKSKLESIRNFYILPYILISENGYYERHIENDTRDFDYWEIKESFESCVRNYLVESVNKFEGITIKNNKCFCYPYNYMLVSNNVGNQIIYKYEDFQKENRPEVTPNPYFSFDVEMSITIGGSIRLVPRKHQGKEHNYDETIPLAKFPTCSWSGDAFINWLTQNAVNIGTSIAETAGGIALNVASGGTTALAGAGIALSGATKTAGIIGQFRDAKLRPSITGGNNTGDINYSNNNNTFKIYKMRSKNEYIKIIDDYFTRYGYKVNSLKKPNISGRTIFNYIEIESTSEIGYGEIPTKAMETINNACRSGVTIWHNHANIGNYNLDNNII